MHINTPYAWFIDTIIQVLVIFMCVDSKNKKDDVYIIVYFFYFLKINVFSRYYILIILIKLSQYDLTIMYLFISKRYDTDENETNNLGTNLS
jgi:hypothetical protein